MKVFTLSTAVTLFAVSAHAAPALNPVQVGARGVFNAPITFYGAAGASYFLSVPTDNSVVYITNPLSISSIDSPSVAFCTITGSDGSVVVVSGRPETVDVAHPQPQVQVSCDI